MRCFSRSGLLLLFVTCFPWLLPAPGCGNREPDAAPDPPGDGETITVAGPSTVPAVETPAPVAGAAAPLSASLTAALDRIPAEDRIRTLPSGTGAAAGQTVYQGQCSSCHGAGGNGDGAAAAFLDPGPGDLTSAEFAARTTPGDKAWLIANGVGGGSAMPGFAKTLSEEQIWQVVAHLETLAP